MAQALFNAAIDQRDGLFEEIVHILGDMPEELREIFVLSHYECRGSHEIASLMRLSPAELEGRLKRANRIFYRSLRKRK